ncbi:DUF2157 domain-containing protein [Sphingobacterium sp. Mn56C]|uniref:DUF2157 domain-containing protein n=1 Tax=Sphingobacterium sp. Mn56C TaxID=3395261 RepID=UPI003BC8CE60
MKKIELSKQDKEVVEEALSHWQEQGMLTEEKVTALLQNIDERSFEWKVLARYAFWVALASLIFSVISLFADDMLVSFIERFYQTPNIVFCLVFAAVAILFFILGFRQKGLYPEKTFSNETLMLAGACATAASIGFLGQVIDRNTHYFSILFFMSVLVYAILAVKLRSKLLWIFMLVALGIWFATETAMHSNWGWKFWGMNFPLRFTIFGALLTLAAAEVQPRVTLLMPFQSTSFVIGLLYTMIALWCLSIFGNYSELESWAVIPQIEIFHWGLLAIVVSLGLTIYGLKVKNSTARDIGFVFFLLNLYTRFVEYLWDSINRTLFFLILALSFWLVGRWSERIWKKQTNKD